MNFALILFILTVVTGVFWVADRRVFLPKRREAARAAVTAFEAANREAIDRGDARVIDQRNDMEARALRQPWWLEYTAGLFPVIAIVFLLRSFLFEPDGMRKGSMLPTLHVGDFILVNKYDYGLRIPVLNTKFLPIGSPERGDVVVFHYPMDESVDYIKRVVGVPGDTVEYRNKVVFVNGVEQKQSEPRDFVDENTLVTLSERDETLNGVTHLMAVDPRRPSAVHPGAVMRREEGCKYNSEGFICTVPEGRYFVMGDNRDNSEDSRYWGFVEDRQLVGRAVLIWANFSDMSRVGGFN